MILTLTACSSTPDKIEIRTTPIQKPQLVLPPVDELRMRPVEWVVINQENMEEKIAELTANGQPLAMFVLTGEGYENLGLNFSDIRALLQQKDAIIIAYENYYQQSQEQLDKAVTID